MTKFDLFFELYKETHKRKYWIKDQFYNFAKLTPILYAANFFLFRSGVSYFESDEQFLSCLYNTIGFISLLLLLLFSWVVAQGYLNPASYKYLAEPEQLATHWDELEKHAAETGQAVAFTDNILNQLIEDGQFNDALNQTANDKKNVAANLIFGILASYVLMIIFMIVALYV